uniref:Uncharacterized protein n=1 Tax=viral metagenome TaxID=1070528 RepID=A0A6C0ESU6_9ZZZZ
MRLKTIFDNKLIRIILALLFFLFIYKIIYSIFIFFSINQYIVQMYMAWIAFLILLVSILPINKYSIKIESESNDHFVP